MLARRLLSTPLKPFCRYLKRPMKGAAKVFALHWGPDCSKGLALAAVCSP